MEEQGKACQSHMARGLMSLLYKCLQWCGRCGNQHTAKVRAAFTQSLERFDNVLTHWTMIQKLNCRFFLKGMKVRGHTKTFYKCVHWLYSYGQHLKTTEMPVSCWGNKSTLGHLFSEYRLKVSASLRYTERKKAILNSCIPWVYWDALPQK